VENEGKYRWQGKKTARSHLLIQMTQAAEKLPEVKNKEARGFRLPLFSLPGWKKG